MAIYNNREVTVTGPARLQATTPDTVAVLYADGSHETVKTSLVKFTKAEKDALIKKHPSDFESVDVISDDDLKAVRAGVAPSYDPSYKEQAKTEIKSEEAQKIDQANKEKAKSEVKGASADKKAK